MAKLPILLMIKNLNPRPHCVSGDYILFEQDSRSVNIGSLNIRSAPSSHLNYENERFQGVLIYTANSDYFFPRLLNIRLVSTIHKEMESLD